MLNRLNTVYYFVSLSLFCCLSVVFSESVGKVLHSSRNEVLDSFHIKASTIIRTQDSRSLGAKYLNETEMNSNEECILWCWEYVPCNLAVFEEKNQGSCYLFDCGPNEDFRCKFTSHNFYTSSVLKTSRLIADSNQWGSQLKHEKDLVRLRSLPTSGPRVLVTGNGQNSTASTTHSLLPPPTHPSVSLRPTPQSKNTCQHYQFQCRNSSECIAIYNVCDGIPQCPDGSDEASDLRCPENYGLPQRTPLSDSNKGQNNKMKSSTDQSKMNKNEVINQLMPSSYHYPNSPDVINDNLKLTKQRPTSSSFGHKYSNFVPGSQQYNRNNFYNGQYQSLWNQYYPQNDVYASTGNHAFSSENDYNSFGRDIQNSPYLGTDNQRGNNYDFSISGNSGMSGNYGQFSKHGSTSIPWQQNYNYYNYQQKGDDGDQLVNVVNQKHLVNVPVPQTNTMNQVETAVNNNSTNGQKAKLASELQDQKETQSYAERKVDHSQSHQESHNHDSMIVVSLLQDPHPGRGRDTNSAVIALILGLCVTAMLVGIVGCRMKSIRRRIARRGRNLAHDADYLVNGMYL